MNKKGFTLIELLAVIIILGILMIIAIPSVTKYISDSRKNAYVDTAKEVIGSARNLVNSGKLEMYATDTTYYIPTSCIKTENDLKSPYGDFTKAYVGVIYDGKGYKYYWISVDDAGQGVSKITPLDKLDTDDIESDLKDSDIENVVTTTGIGNRSEIKILNCSNNNWDGQYHLDDTSNNVSEEGSSSGGSTTQKIICKRGETLHTDDYGTTYGRIGNGSTLNSGEIFDCDVNGDGTYDEEKERFYYMHTSDGIANLIFYTNVYNGEISNSSTVAYYGSGYDSSKGPVSAAVHLPSTTKWQNVSLSNPHRQIKSYYGNTYVRTYDAPIVQYDLPIFDYSSYAARMLSIEDIEAACGARANLGDYVYFNESNNCLYFIENTVYNSNMTGLYSYGYFLETTEDYQGGVKMVYGYSKYTGSSAANTGHLYGVRPVIEVPIEQIQK